MHSKRRRTRWDAAGPAGRVRRERLVGGVTFRVTHLYRPGPAQGAAAAREPSSAELRDDDAMARCLQPMQLDVGSATLSLLCDPANALSSAHDHTCTGHILWPAARILAARMLEILGTETAARTSVIELGAGLGAVGIAAAAAGARVALTDVAGVLPLTRRNCDANSALFEAQRRPHVTALNWCTCDRQQARAVWKSVRPGPTSPCRQAPSSWVWSDDGYGVGVRSVRGTPYVPIQAAFHTT